MRRWIDVAAVVLGVVHYASVVSAFQFQVPPKTTRMIHHKPLAAKRHRTLAREEQQLPAPIFDPLDLAKDRELLSIRNDESTSNHHLQSGAVPAALLASSAAVCWSAAAQQAVAEQGIDLRSFDTGNLTPETFQPVCAASDGFYRVLQTTAQGLVGPEKFVEYGPLIASGLLRVRLELCVLESFFNEAVGPFIRDNGLSWVLPLHETVETFLAGGIFAVATTFILIGSTKLVTVIVTYTDFLLGLPSRLIGGFAFDRARGKPVTLDIGFGPFKTRVIGPPEPKEGEEAEFKFYEANILTLIVLALSGALNVFGKVFEFLRKALEAVDAFVGRYLVLWASFYLIIKFLHFKVFPDFPPF